MKIKINPDKTQVTKIRQKLEENKEKYGKQYCPCSLLHDDDHVCLCKDFLEQTEEGYCHCTLYYKSND